MEPEPAVEKGKTDERAEMVGGCCSVLPVW